MRRGPVVLLHRVRQDRCFGGRDFSPRTSFTLPGGFSRKGRNVQAGKGLLQRSSLSSLTTESPSLFPAPAPANIVRLLLSPNPGIQRMHTPSDEITSSGSISIPSNLIFSSSVALSKLRKVVLRSAHTIRDRPPESVPRLASVNRFSLIMHCVRITPCTCSARSCRSHCHPYVQRRDSGGMPCIREKSVSKKQSHDARRNSVAYFSGCVLR